MVEVKEGMAEAKAEAEAAVAEVVHRPHVVGDEEDRDAAFFEVADAAVALDSHAGAEVAHVAGARDHLVGLGRVHHRFLAGVAVRVRVRDVVRRGVDRLLVREQSAQRGLKSCEGGDRHRLRPYACASTTR